MNESSHILAAFLLLLMSVPLFGYEVHVLRLAYYLPYLSQNQNLL